MEDNQITDNDKEDDKQDRIELVQRAVEGDKEAFTNLYMLTYSEVYHIVKVFIHNEDTAQDIVQETYYKSLRKIKQLKEPDKFPVWIKKIAVNTAKAHLRKVDWVLFSEADGEGGKSIAELQDERLEHIPEIVVDQAETKKMIDQILGELDEKQRMVVGMFYYEQMSVNEIAEALNCSVNTVKSRLNYARKKIGKEIAELEKKGVILRTAAPIPILMYLFQKLRGVQEQIPKAKFLVKAGIEKAIVTGIAAAAICMGIGIGAAKIPDRHQQVQEAYEEPVYEYHVFCNTCGADVTTNAQEHEAIHNAGFSSRKIQTGSIHHDAVTQQVWVDEPAYDEVMTRGYVCSVCGAAK
ncbi:sigma-70 family RNA polymerase sigma factor [Lachnospiraceae bacterium BSM-380-WT-5A]|uniref:Sigma-70 family RNA polymerase sigma factor n=1 Tax=Oliverpabstia intestinalis TaxID=2606633 RepID=A0A7X2P4K4_9FIRM|nr:sigma-70 family RNA polymerase sigma factor [Oliverpabstia intestinalis]MST67395.1 sigma-70 family RNA polymerase sigma factor [Oliverpabstia intestinalis]